MVTCLSLLDSTNITANLVYKKDEGFKVFLKDNENEFPSPLVDADFLAKTPKDINKFLSWVKDNYSTVITKVDGIYKVIYNPNACLEIHSLKQKMFDCDDLSIPTTSILTAEDKGIFDRFLKSKNKVCLAVRDKNNLAIAEELTNKLLTECKTKKDYIPVMVDLKKLDLDNLNSVKTKYGEEGNIIGHADYSTVFIVNGFEAVKEFNFYNSMSKKNNNFKVILFIPDSYVSEDKMLYLYLPQSSHLSVGTPEIHYLSTDEAVSKEAAEDHDNFDVYYV